MGAPGRRIFVGDLQGCLEPFEALLEGVGFVPGRDTLFPVGDLVNKGPDSAGVVRRCMELDARPVLGNHDLLWLEQRRLAPEQDRWLRAQPVVRVLDDLIVVHAGLHPDWGERELRALTPEQIDYAVNVRYIDPEGRRAPRDWPPPGPPYRPWDDFYRGRKRVVFGHWARRGLVVRPQCVGLDTGCVYGGELSAWIAGEDRVVRVPGL